MAGAFPRRPLDCIVLLVSLGIFSYSNTLDVPFHLDDWGCICNNPVIKDLGYLTDLSGAEGLDLTENVSRSLRSRRLGYLSFALNHRLHGLDVRGYHLVNLSIHVTNAVLVYCLLLLAFRTPFLEGSRLREYSGGIAFFSALVFLSHPVQTQAVTYIIQRFASLAAFFYLLSLVAYIKSRLSKGRSSRIFLYGVSILSAVCAMKTKENAFTLPVLVALFEFSFMSAGAGKRALLLLPLMLTMLIVPLSLMDPGAPLGEALSDATRLQEEITRGDYLVTEFRVVGTYLRLLVLPVNQNLDYDYPLQGSFLEPEVFLSFLLHLSLLGVGMYLLNRSRRGEPALRLVSFGIFWFFITLSVESSIIPITDVIFEHRMYLPSVGVFTALTVAVFYAIGTGGTARCENERAPTLQMPTRCGPCPPWRVRAAVWGLVLLCVIFSGASYARNDVWRSGTRLWEDVVEKSPLKARGHSNLGREYLIGGLTERAMSQFGVALKLDPEKASAKRGLAFGYKAQGRYEEAAREFRAALRLEPDSAGARMGLDAVLEKMDR
jgi:tetratricopeptide (TPR) repeat protein